MIRSVPIAIALLFLAVRPASAYDQTPAVWPECLDRDLWADLESVQDFGVRPLVDWERLAIDAITRDGLSKGIADLIRTGCGVAGFAHFRPTDPFRIGMSSDLDCPIDDPDWSRYMLAILYSDQSAAIQLVAWRRIVGPAVRTARSHGWRSVHDLALAASVANSDGSSGFEARGATCEWDPDCVAESYAKESRHRRRRIEWLRDRR